MAKYHEEDYFSAYAISQILGGGITSRLLGRLRHEEGITYCMNSEYITEPQSNRMDLSGDIPATQYNEALDMIFDEFHKLQTTPVPQDEIEKIITNREYHLIKAYHQPKPIVTHIASNIENNSSTDNDLNRLKAVTPQSIMDAAVKYLPKNRSEGNYVLLLKDPLKKEAEYNILGRE